MAEDGSLTYRRRYGIPIIWDRPASDANELHFILDNEAARWMAGEGLRVCGRCGAQTYFDVCPELCRNQDNKPLELHEGHLTNVVAALRAENDEKGVEDVFKYLDEIYPYRAPDETKIKWAPDVAEQKARERRDQELREAIARADVGSDQ